jgi:hypothetical protein
LLIIRRVKLSSVVCHGRGIMGQYHLDRPRCGRILEWRGLGKSRFRTMIQVLFG